MSETLRVWVGATIIYLYGTVNGTEATFTLIGDGYWQAIVPRTEDDKYTLHLEAYSTNGLEGTYDYTMSYGMPDLITDRTISDVRNKTDKGYYGATDLNRVGETAIYLKTTLDGLPAVLSEYEDTNGVAPDELFDVPYLYPMTISPKTNWAAANIPTPTQLLTYLENVSTLREVLALPDGTPSVPSDMEKFNYIEANNIEIILFAVDAARAVLEASKKALIDKAVAGFRHCGTFYCGQGVILP